MMLITVKLKSSPISAAQPGSDQPVVFSNFTPGGIRIHDTKINSNQEVYLFYPPTKPQSQNPSPPTQKTDPKSDEPTPPKKLFPPAFPPFLNFIVLFESSSKRSNLLPLFTYKPDKTSDTILP